MSPIPIRGLRQPTPEQSELGKLYMPEETRPEILRLKIDQLEKDLDRIEISRGAEARRTETLINDKHDSASRAIAALIQRVNKAENKIEKLDGDPTDSEDHGSVGRVQRSVKRLWAKTELATKERWKMRLTFATYGGGSAAGVIGILKAFGAI